MEKDGLKTQDSRAYSSARCFSLVLAWLILSVLLRSICFFNSFFSLFREQQTVRGAQLRVGGTALLVCSGLINVCGLTLGIVPFVDQNGSISP